MAREYPAIPEPAMSLASHQETLIPLKEAVEVLTRQRGNRQNSAAMLKEIALKLDDAPHDGFPYYRVNGAWVRVPP